jgi:hypothetical protein
MAARETIINTAVIDFAEMPPTTIVAVRSIVDMIEEEYGFNLNSFERINVTNDLAVHFGVITAAA